MGAHHRWMMLLMLLAGGAAFATTRVETLPANKNRRPFPSGRRDDTSAVA